MSVIDTHQNMVVVVVEAEHSVLSLWKRSNVMEYVLQLLLLVNGEFNDWLFAVVHCVSYWIKCPG